MNEEKVKEYVGKKVLLILSNGFKFTATIPDFEGNTFDIVDRYKAKVTIDCGMISLIVEQKSGGQ